jgi:hypothetical protein
MPNPPTRSIYLPNYKVAVDVPSNYTDEQIDDAVRRNKAMIQAQSSIAQQTAQNLQRNTSELGITPQQARQQGISPAIQGNEKAKQDATTAAALANIGAANAYQYHGGDLNPNEAQRRQLLAGAQSGAASVKALTGPKDVFNTPLTDYLLDYGAPGASDALSQMNSFGARLAQGLTGATSPQSMAGMAVAGPVIGSMGRAGQTAALLGLGATSVPSAVQDARGGNYSGALGTLAAGFAPVGLHAILPPIIQGLANRFPDFGFPVQPPAETPPTMAGPATAAPLRMLGETPGPLPYNPGESLPNGPRSPGDRFNLLDMGNTPAEVPSAAPPVDPALAGRVGRMEIGNRIPTPDLAPPEIDPAAAGQTLQMEQAPAPKVKSKYGLKGYEAQALADAMGVTTDAPVPEVAPRTAPDIAPLPMAVPPQQQQGVPQNAPAQPTPVPSSTAPAVAPHVAGGGPASVQQQAPPAMSVVSDQPSGIVSPQVVSPRVEIAYTADNNPVQFRYAAVPGDSLQTSHKDTGSALDVNPGYDQTLQPRDRSRMASLAQVDTLGRELNPTRLGASPTTYDGAPIVGPDLHVESGNARTLGILRHTAAGDTSGYGDYVRSNAAAFGLDPAAVAQVKNPVLIRMREGQTTPEQRSSLAEEMGRSPIASMSTIEQATGDAKKLRSSGILSQLRPTESGDLGAENTGFARSFLRHVVPAAEHGTILQENGHLSAPGQQRIRNAILAAAYPNHGVLSRMMESTDENTRAISRAMLAVAPHLADLQDKIASGELHKLDIAPALAEAANTISHLREKGQKVKDFLAQQNMFGEDLSPVAKDLLELMDQHARSGKKLTDILKAYVDLAHKAGDPRNARLFEEVGDPTQEDILEAAVRTATGNTADLFGSTDAAAQQTEHAASSDTAQSRGQSAAEAKRARLAETHRSGAQATEPVAAPKPAQSETLAPKGKTAPLTLTADEGLALADVLGHEGQFAKVMDQAFADGRAKNVFQVTLDQLTALRTVTEKTKNTPGSYSRSAVLKRIKLAEQSLDSASATPTTPERVQYHGTSKAFTPGSIYSMEQHRNLYGPGLYTTDSPEIARSYTKKGGGTAPTVYRVQHAKANPNLLDLEKPLPPDVYKLFSEGDYGYGMNPDMKGTAVYQEWKDNLANDGLTVHDAEEHMHGITDELQKLGYDGYSHTGGAKTGGTPHHVEIYFADPIEGKVPVTMEEVKAESAPSQILPKKAGSHSGAIRLGGPVNPNSPQAKYGPAIAKALGAEEIASAATLGKQAAAVVKSVVSPSTMTPEAGQGARIIRAHAAENARKMERAYAAMGPFVKIFETMPEAEQLAFIDAIETGSSQPHPELQQVANVLRNALDEGRDEVRALGTGALENYIENYFPHIWKQPTDAAKTLAKSFTGGASLEGKKSFLKQRSIPTTAAGIAAGLVPVTTNPLELALLKIAEVNRFVMGQKILQEMHGQGFLTFEQSNVPSPGMAAINDKVAKVFRPSSAKVVDDNGKTITQDIDGHLIDDKGRIQSGQWVAPEAVARVLNNFLSPGLSANPLYQILRTANNLMNMAELGLSLFHLTGTTINAAMSKASLALQEGSRGEIVPAAMNALKTPTAVFEYLHSGNKVLKEYLKPGASPDMDILVQAIIEGGGRVSMDREFRTNFVKTMRQAFRSGHHAKGVLNAVPALLEATAIPIMQWYVPRLKLGAYVDMARSEMASKHWQSASADEKRQVLAEAWDSIDNRFGQLVYDNLFWNKTLKDVSLIAVRSVGWNLGTIRELGGAAADIPGTPKRIRAGRGISPKMAYAIALPVITALLCALYGYAHGKPPKTAEDYFNPQDSHGDRIALPTYMKDVQSYSKRPVRTLWNKKSPLVSTVLDMLANKDFLGKPIRNSDDPIVKQAQQEVSHVAGLFEPFAVKDMIESRQKGASTGQQIERFFGITPIHAAKGDRGQTAGAR